MIKTVNLQKIFKTEEVETWALNNVNLEIKAGEFVAIMGPSGCGKSTLLNILGLLDNPTGGTYELNGTDVSKFTEAQRTNLRKGVIGFVRLSEARAVALELVSSYTHTTIVDTILCLDGTEVIGACMASELTRDGYVNMNAHQTIYVVTPEHTTGSQLLFRENTSPMIAGKHVLILAASVTTGYTAQAAVEAINYYGGQVVGIGAIFATQTECAGYPVTSIFDPNDLGDYQSYDSRDCPWCKQGKRIDALVNSFGYSSL